MKLEREKFLKLTLVVLRKEIDCAKNTEVGTEYEVPVLSALSIEQS